MIKVLIVIILILLYLWFGLNLFFVAVNEFGGKEEYIKEIGPDLYRIAFTMVVLCWPYFLISALRRRKK